MFPLTYRKPLPTALVTTASAAVIVLKAQKYQGRKDHLPITEIQFELRLIQVTLAFKYPSSTPFLITKLPYLLQSCWITCDMFVY